VGHPVSAIGASLALALALTGCGDTVPPPPPETFTWSGGQPISFSPPPGGWERSRYQNGGTEGVSFTRTGSGGEQIFVAEQLFLGRRDRCLQIQEVLRELYDYNKTTFGRAMLDARLYAKEPFSADEERVIEVVNQTLDRAREAYLDDDMVDARNELSRALEQAGEVRFSIDETVDRVLFTAEKNQVYPALQVGEPRAAEVAGERAVLVDFVFEPRGERFVGRRVYVIRNNRMFELGYQGLEENLPLFGRIVDSVAFPTGRCEH